MCEIPRPDLECILYRMSSTNVNVRQTHGLTLEGTCMLSLLFPAPLLHWRLVPIFSGFRALLQQSL